MPLDYVRERCETIEKVLKLQFAPDPLPPHFQKRLQTCPPDSPENLVERWVTLSHLLRSYRDGLTGWEQGPQTSDEDAEEAARKLLQREPVEVELAYRTVEVTGRSYAAMHAMARHESRMEELREDLERISDLRDEAREDRPRFQRLGRIQRLALQELQLHRKALYAHAFTEDGAPAEAPMNEAPEWWDEVDPAEDALLLMALFEAGPGRLAKLGPAEDQDGGGKKSDDWGYKSLLASLERQTRSEPASYFNRDMGQLIAWVRGGAPPKPEGLEE